MFGDDCETLELYVRTEEQTCPYYGEALSFRRVVVALCGRE